MMCRNRPLPGTVPRSAPGASWPKSDCLLLICEEWKQTISQRGKWLALRTWVLPQGRDWRVATSIPNWLKSASKRYRISPWHPCGFVL